MKINVLLLMGTNSRNAGGLVHSVKSLAKELEKDKQTDLSILSHNDAFSSEDIKTWADLKMLIYTVKGPLSFGFSLDLFKLLKKKNPQIIHQQGIWMFSSKVALKFLKLNNSVNIITPRGMLDYWAINNSSFKKKLVGAWFEYKNLKNAGCIQALCKSEYLAIRDFGLKVPIAIIPNGINLPEKQGFKRIINNEKKILLFIGRIHPKKGLDSLIEALYIINQTHSELLNNWEVRIAGWNQVKHQEYLTEKCVNYKLEKVVTFIGSVYGEIKEQELVNADAFILPSFSEGLPMSILEAWSYKLPVVMTKECNIPEGFENNAAIEINHSPKDISTVLIDLFLKENQELSEIGVNGYELVKSKFTWEKIAEDTKEMYSWVLGESDKPNFIHLD
jgi:poly(glycerol-phosphate) alpha-glucosyltransferase